MVNFLIIIGLIVLAIVLIVNTIKYLSFKRYLLNNFRSCNCIVAGKKGRGKGLVFQYVINKIKDFYYSNV